MKDYPKVLVVSNNAFSKTGSNGRTLGNLFTNWDSGKIAQFYIYNEEPLHCKCENYYRITDKNMIKSIFTRKSGEIL